MAAPNYPHKLTNAAEPWLGGGAALGGSNCTPASRRLPVRSGHCVLVAAAAAPLPGGRHGRRPLQLRVSALAGPCDLRVITNRHNDGSSPLSRFPLAAPRGEERAATSKTRRRRSDTSGTQFFAFCNRSRRVPEVSLHRRPAHARRGPFLTRHPPRRVRAIQLSVTLLALHAKLRCACRAASSAPVNSMALGEPRRRRRCSRAAQRYGRLICRA